MKMTNQTNQTATAPTTAANSLRVTLQSSKNEFLRYPAIGKLTITESFLDGSISAVFQLGKYDDCKFIPDGGPVVVKNPVFNFA